MIKAIIYCRKDGSVADVYVVYAESHQSGQGMQLVGYAGGNTGSGNFDTEWLLINFDDEGNPVSGVVAEDRSDNHLVEFKRKFLFDQSSWKFIETEADISSEIDQSVAERIESINSRWIEFDEQDRLCVCEMMNYQFEASNTATVGEVDEDHLSWLSKIWSLRADF